MKLIILYYKKIKKKSFEFKFFSLVFLFAISDVYVHKNRFQVDKKKTKNILASCSVTQSHY
jgi:hypothetical protein